MKPYYEDNCVQIWHGDCLELLPLLPKEDTCITDPVWPNSVFPYIADPQALFSGMCALLTSDRLVVQLGCMSDPRFLSAVPQRFKFLRACWLSYATPSHIGRILMGADVAYAYGTPPSSKPGRRVLGGQCMAKMNDTKGWNSGRGTGSSLNVDYGALPHPCPRRLEHVQWLCRTFAESTVIDPFAGTMTTLLAAKSCGLRAIGIEREEKYCEIGAKRLGQSMLALPDAEAMPAGRGQ